MSSGQQQRYGEREDWHTAEHRDLAGVHTGPDFVRNDTIAGNDSSLRARGGVAMRNDEIMGTLVDSAQLQTTTARRKQSSFSTPSTTGRQSLDAQHLGSNPLGTCPGALGIHTSRNESMEPLLSHQQNDGLQGSTRERHSSQNQSIMLPRWQPDTEVDECTVCKTRFSWLFRKHHCRKCGCVVCASCSQHRITIPRKYIVQPPEQIMAGSFGIPIPDLPNSSSANVVRVCNPCVPDPNLSPPPQSLGTETSHRPQVMPTHQPQASDANQRSFLRIQSPPQCLDTLGNRAHRTHLQGEQLPRNHFHQALQPLDTLSSLPSQTAGSQGLRHHTHRRSTLSGALVAHHQLYSENWSAHSRGRSTSGQLDTLANGARMPRPRPRVTEDDECPVCGREMPPHDDSNDDAARARHIVDCINSYGPLPSGSSMSSHIAAESRKNPITAEGTTSNSLDPGLGSARAFSSYIASNAALQLSRSTSLASPSSSNSGVLRMHRRPRMLEYKATEKDCLDDHGDPQECIICFEEFQVADDMARLECLCKFHMRCIVGWWRAKNVQENAGAKVGCPTHVLHS